LLALLAVPSLGFAADPAPACDRACLKSMLDRYLSAVVKHDPSGAPLAIAYRHTENAINVPLGKGVWQSVTGLGKVQRYYLDPVSEQAAYYGVVEENDRLAVVTARLTSRPARSPRPSGTSRGTAIRGSRARTRRTCGTRRALRRARRPSACCRPASACRATG